MTPQIGAKQEKEIKNIIVDNNPFKTDVKPFGLRNSDSFNAIEVSDSQSDK